LTVGDAGYVAEATDTVHLVTWNGTAFVPLDGDESGRIEFFAVAPSSAGWALCDGTATTLLQFGATLTLVAFTTPNLAGTPAYLKSGAAYTGVINAASGSTGTGTTGAESGHTHGVTTNNHQHNVPAQTPTTGATSSWVVFPIGTGSNVQVPTDVHTHAVTVPAQNTDAAGGETVTSGAGSGHTHSVPALGVGTIDPRNVVLLPYVRR
jgi:hypothetical protein